MTMFYEKDSDTHKRAWQKPSANRLVIVIFSGIISACATTGEKLYTDAQGQNVVTIKNTFERNGLVTWQHFFLHSVEGKRIPQGLFSLTDNVKLHPGKSKIVATAYFNDGNGPYEAQIPMQVELSPGETYYIRGKISDLKPEVWLTTSSADEKVSRSFFGSTKYHLKAPIVMKYRLR